MFSCVVPRNNEAINVITLKGNVFEENLYAAGETVPYRGTQFENNHDPSTIPLFSSLIRSNVRSIAYVALRNADLTKTFKTYYSTQSKA
jgi:hypothetical protein